MKKFAPHLIAALTLAACAAAQAGPIVLTFEGAGSNASLTNFYNGGTDSQGNSGTNYGIAFGSNALSSIDADAGGWGNFANEPSSGTVMYFLTGTAVLNYALGFDTGFSFYYSSASAASVVVYDGLDATGNVLATINLTAQYADNCGGDPTGSFCNWTAVGAAFNGIAKSIDFGGTVNKTGYDNITFGAATPVGNVPEPASLALVGLALAGLAGATRRRARPSLS